MRGKAGGSVLVDLEGHGREDLFPGVDLSRTVGWFTAMYPVRLDPGQPDSAEIAAGGPAAGLALRRIEEQLRAVPHNGIGWGMLRHLNSESAGQLQALPRPEIAFNYLGRFDEAGGSGWRSAAESPGASVSPHRSRDHLLEVVALVQGGALRMEWSWWPRAHDRASIADLAAHATAALRGVIRHCTAADVGGYTPSDFPLAQLDEDRLAALHRHYPNMEDIWPLAPMQHEILLHARHAPDSRAGHHQLCLTLDGAIDAAALEQAWRALPARHAALRVAIAENGMVTHQVVRRSLQLPWRFADWSALPADAREGRLQDFLAQERTERFDLAQDPLLRGALLRSSPTQHMLVLSFHHILLDGWSMPILLRELLEIYQAARRGHSAALPPTQPYRDYLAWLATVDRAADEAFWCERLAGLEKLRLDLPAGDSASSPDALGEHCVALSDLSTSRLQALAQARRLTMSTMVQGAWALVLARQGLHGDIVFGMTTAGRPGDLAGIERMVGLCTNTLPRRVRPDPAARFTDWLGDLQVRQAEEQTHAWCRLDDIRRWSGAPASAALFDSVVVFENYPVGTSLAGHAVAGAPDLTVSAVASLEQGVHFPLCLVVGPGSRLTFRLAFGRRRFATEAIEGLADDLVRLLTALAADPDQSVSALWSVAGRQRADQAGAVAEVGAS